VGLTNETNWDGVGNLIKIYTMMIDTILQILTQLSETINWALGALNFKFRGALWA
jgi:hypothetical protein